MRLIDADKLIEICDKGWRLGSAINTKIYHTVDASDIRSQPTVEAIPIEWIEKWFSQFYGEQGLEWNRCKRFMLQDWEKENEANAER